MPSFGTLKADTLTHSTAGSLATNYVVEGSAKAWVRYNGSTPAINDSFNVTSLTDDGVGDHTFTFTNSMTDTNFAFSGHSSQYHTGNDNIASSSTVNVFTANSSHSKSDAVRSSCMIHGDLA